MNSPPQSKTISSSARAVAHEYRLFADAYEPAHADASSAIRRPRMADTLSGKGARPRGALFVARRARASRFGNSRLSMRAAALVALVALARADLLQGPGDMHVSGDLTVAGALEARSPACAPTPTCLPQRDAACGARR